MSGGQAAQGTRAPGPEAWLSPSHGGCGAAVTTLSGRHLPTRALEEVSLPVLLMGVSLHTVARALGQYSRGSWESLQPTCFVFCV